MKRIIAALLLSTFLAVGVAAPIQAAPAELQAPMTLAVETEYHGPDIVVDGCCTWLGGFFKSFGKIIADMVEWWEEDGPFAGDQCPC